MRTPMVTRTITTTEAELMCLNVASGVPETHKVLLSGQYKDNKDVLKASKKLIETEELKVVHVVNTLKHEDLYGMTEQKFLEFAKVLPKRGATNDSEEG